MSSINTFIAEWRIYASFSWICLVWIDVYIRQCDNFSHTCLQQNFLQMFFISRHTNPETFIQIDQKLFELLSLVANHLTSLGYKTFSKKLGANACLATHNNIFCTHLVTMKIYNNVLHTYPHNLWKFQVILARTFLVMLFGIKQQFARLRVQHFLENA